MRNPARIGHFRCKSLLKSSGAEDARTAMTMAEKGLGIAILPESMLKLTNKLKAYDITGADLTTEILLAWRKGRMPAELQDFLTLFEEKI